MLFFNNNESLDNEVSELSKNSDCNVSDDPKLGQLVYMTCPPNYWLFKFLVKLDLLLLLFNFVKNQQVVPKNNRQTQVR